MDGSRFDAWTRRRFGLAATGIAGSLLALVHPEQNVATAKKKGKKKKKKCGSLGAFCNPAGKPTCCGNLDCEYRFFGGPHCCRRAGEDCQSGAECCSGECADDFTCDCKLAGEECIYHSHCCSDKCVEGQCAVAV